MQMLDAGASGYLIKNSASEDMVRALGIVVGGQSFLSPAITDQVIHVATDQHRDESAFSVLTNREREVLQLLAEGRSSKEIAAELYLSVKTIEARRRDIMNKLDIHNVAALTRYAIREGITTAHL
jgi:DNA-binding NarL/FixJ family response regulator